MNNNGHLPQPDILERAIESLQNAQVSQPSSLRRFESTIAALKSQSDRSGVVPFRKQRSSYMHRVIRYSKYAAAAILLAVAASLAWGPNNSTSSAFGQIVENIKKATSVTFTCKYKLGTEPEVEKRCYYQGDMLCSEIIADNKTLIWNTKTRDAVTVDHARKAAAKFKFDRDLPGAPKSPLDMLTSIAVRDDATEIGEEELDGKKTQVYRLTLLGSNKKATGETAKVWVDPDSGLPIRIESQYVRPDRPTQQPEISGICENFKWNLPLKPELFEVPQGYAIDHLVPGGILHGSPGKPIQKKCEETTSNKQTTPINGR